MKKFTPPSNPWFCAVTTDAAVAAGLPANTRVVVRQSRTGGWRVLTRTRQVVIGEKFAAKYLVTEKPAVIYADQAGGAARDASTSSTG